MIKLFPKKKKIQKYKTKKKKKKQILYGIAMQRNKKIQTKTVDVKILPSYPFKKNKIITKLSLLILISLKHFIKDSKNLTLNESKAPRGVAYLNKR